MVGWGEGWPSELECEARHLSCTPGESTNGGIKKNRELNGLIPTADLAAVRGTAHDKRGGGRLPLQCCASCSTSGILRRSLSTCSHSLEKGREWDTHLQHRDQSAS